MELLEILKISNSASERISRLKKIRSDLYMNKKAIYIFRKERKPNDPEIV